MKLRIGGNSISVTLFAYWFVLVIWQNVSSVSSRSEVDIAIKIVLLAFLCISFAIKSRLKIANALVMGVFFLTQVVSLLNENNPTFSVYIFYIYTGLIIVLVFGLGHNFVISKRELQRVYDAIILVALYAAVYALLFRTDHFLSAFSITSAYGNELSSFFSSNHEYAMYMAAAIICCVIGLEMNNGKSTKKSLFYILSLLLLVPNLVLAFSRTVLLGTAFFFLIYLVGAKNTRLKKWIFVGSTVSLFVFLFNSRIRAFVNGIIFKGKTSAGRDYLYATAEGLFKKGSLLQKAFGYGIGYSRTYLEEMTSHGSVHNAYLQMLLYFGIVGLAWLIGFLVVRIRSLLKLCAKNRYWGYVFLGLITWAALMMYTNTFLIFTSSADCYFLTFFAIIIPMFSANAIKNESFETDPV